MNTESSVAILHTALLLLSISLHACLNMSHIPVNMHHIGPKFEDQQRVPF